MQASPFVSSLAVFLVVFTIAGLVYALVFHCNRCRWVEVSPGFFTPASVTFGLIVGFMASQIWADNSKAVAAVTREASALRSIVLIADIFPANTRGEINEIANRHIDHAVNVEWPEMHAASSYHGIIDTADQHGLKTALTITPTNEAQVSAKKILIDTVRSLYDARSERLLLSGTSINPLKWLIVSILAFMLMLITALVHKSNAKSAFTALAILSTVIASSYVLVIAHDRPFTGYISISPDLLIKAVHVRP